MKIVIAIAVLIIVYVLIKDKPEVKKIITKIKKYIKHKIIPVIEDLIKDKLMPIIKKFDIHNKKHVIIAVVALTLLICIPLSVHSYIEEKNNAAAIRELNCRRGIGECRGYNEINRLKDIQFGN